MHALTTSAKSVVLAGASAIQILSEKKETLTQRIDTLRADLQALHRAHAITIASLQAEQKKWDLGLTDQEAKNVALQTVNNELRGNLTLYQGTLNSHRCSGYPGAHFFLEKKRILSRARGESIEVFLWYLKLT